jgi:hypothetical protein
MTCGPYALILGINKVSWASHICSFWLAVALDAVEVIWHLNRWWGRCLACISPFCLCFCFGARDPSSPLPTDVAMSHNLHPSPALSIGITRHATLPPVPAHLACAQLRASPGGRHKHNTTDGDGLSELGHGIPDSSSSRSRTVSSRRDFRRNHAIPVHNSDPCPGTTTSTSVPIGLGVTSGLCSIRA